MQTDFHERRRYQRQTIADRPGFEVGVILHGGSLIHDDEPQSVEIDGHPIDWSLGGMQLELDCSAPWSSIEPMRQVDLLLRRHVDVLIRGPEQTLSLRAEVVHHYADRRIGLQFVEADREALSHFFN